MNEYQNDTLENLTLQVDEDLKLPLSQMAKWTKFISVSMFVLMGLLAVLFVVGGTAFLSNIDKFGKFNVLAGLESGIIIGIIIFAVVIFAVIFYFMYNFSVKTKAALMCDDGALLASGIQSLKTFVIINAILGMISLLVTIITLFNY